MSELPIVERLRERAKIAREEGNMTAKCDADNFEESALLITELVAALEIWDTWSRNWNLPFDGDDEWRDDKATIDAALARARSKGGE